MKIGIVTREENSSAVELAGKVSAWCTEKGHEVLVTKNFSVEQIAKQADLIVTLGGDGTLIGVGRYCVGESPPILGVNFGTLGFLTEVMPDECMHYLERAVNGDISIGSRTLVNASVSRGGKKIFQSQGVNEALIQKGTREGMLQLDIFVNKERIMHLRGDGLMVATPTGSTAYSLAAGGAIVHPELSALLLTPICAHSLTAKPVILPDTAVLSTTIPNFEGEIFLSMDGQEWCGLEAGDEISIGRSNNTVRFVQSDTNSYLSILRNKLHWG